MFKLTNYDIPIDLLIHVILKHISYFELDHILPCFRLSAKEIAIIKYKIYKQRLKVTKCQQTTEYCVENKLHREDGPAMDFANGYKSWYLNGIRHRTDGPAVEDANGTKAWFIDGKLHRLDGPAVEQSDGDKEWWVDGKRHRLDGPACEWNIGRKSWFVNGERHNPNGPAIEYTDGHKEWWVHGELVPPPDSC